MSVSSKTLLLCRLSKSNNETFSRHYSFIHHGDPRACRRGMGVRGAVAVAATAAFYALLVRTRAPCGVDGTFCGAREGLACARLRAHLHGHLHGQTVATDLLADAICDHLETPHPSKPLVLAVHGPPGVGKSYFHQLLAQAVYGAADEDEEAPVSDGATTDATTDAKNASSSSFAIDAVSRAARRVARAVRESDLVGFRKERNRERRGSCPGPDCPAYAIVFGTDYASSEAEAQSAALRDALLRRLRSYASSVLVVEEYDKMGCAARGVLRQLLEKGERDEAEFKRSIFVLEANAGFATIKKTLDEETFTAKAEAPLTTPSFSPAATTRTQRFLRDLVFSRWADDACEDLADTKRAVAAVDVFAPFLPLDRRAIESIVRRHLDARREDKTDPGLNGDAALRSLTYDETPVLAFLTNQVEFEGAYAIEGGKEAPAALSRFVTRALRKAALRERDAIFGFAAEKARTNALGGKDVHISVSPRGNELVATVSAQIETETETLKRGGGGIGAYSRG